MNAQAKYDELVILYNNLVRAYNTQTGKFGGSQSALRLAREHRNRLKMRVQELESLLRITEASPEFDSALEAILVLRKTL